MAPITTCIATSWRTLPRSPRRRRPPRRRPLAPFGLSLPSFKPLPDNKGDEDGLSGDVNDCNKGCIDGNPE
jgi:hypothetical protein